VTLVVGFNLGTYALMVADTRASHADGTHADGDEKIQETDIGIISGAGLVDLLDPVKRRIAETRTLSHTTEILAIIREERERLEGVSRLYDPRVLQIFEHTTWMFSYLAGENPKTVDDMSMRLAIPHPKTGDLHLALVNRCRILAPSGTTEEQAVDWLNRIDGHVRSLAHGDDIWDNIWHHVRVGVTLLHDVAAVNSQVSKSFQFGIHSIPHDFFISEVMNVGDPLAWKIMPERLKNKTASEDGSD